MKELGVKGSMVEGFGIRPFTVRDTEEIIRNFLRTRGEQGATEDEIRKVVNEIAHWKVLGTVAAMVVAQKLAVNLVGGEVVVGLPKQMGPAEQ